jgi:hypothetical protein
MAERTRAAGKQYYEMDWERELTWRCLEDFVQEVQLERWLLGPQGLTAETVSDQPGEPPAKVGNMEEEKVEVGERKVQVFPSLT